MANILVVDDEQMIRVLLRSALETEGHRIQDADCGEKALEIVGLFEPDIVISDIRMDGMSGFDLLHAVRKKPETMHTPFIFITGVGGRETFRKSMDMGADDFLEKPFSDEELLASVRTRLQLRTLLKEQNERAMDELRQSITLALPHEFRTPLNAVLAFSKIIAEDDDVTVQEMKKLAGMIHSAGKRLHHLAENYLAYAQIELSATDPSTLNHLRQQVTRETAAVVRSCAVDKAEEYGRRSDLFVRVDPASCLVSHDHVSRIANEIIDNAFKFSSPGDPVRVAGMPYEGAYILDIEDGGKGMPGEDTRRLDFFRQFGRKQNEQQGVGLGLSIAKGLVELYRGTLEIESRPGSGTRVRITLPLAASDDPAHDT